MDLLRPLTHPLIPVGSLGNSAELKNATNKPQYLHLSVIYI